MFMLMDLTTSNIVMKGIFLLILAIIGGYIANTLGCKTQKLMETNMAVKHIVTIMIVYFAMDLSSQFQEKQISPFENLKLSFIIYFFFLLFTKMNIQFTIVTFILLGISYFLTNYIKYINNNESQLSKLLIKITEIIYLLIILLVLVGFTLYYIKQRKQHSKNFTHMKYLFGILNCSYKK